MTGKAMESFIPTHLSALDRSPGVKAWLEGWTGGDVEFLSPDIWFHHDHGLAWENYEDIIGGVPSPGHSTNEFDEEICCSEGLKWPKITPGKVVWCRCCVGAGLAPVSL